jgi:hypothetical protein
MANVITTRPSLLDTTGSSLKSTTLVDAFAEGMILMLNGEKQYNRKNTLNPIGLPTLSNNYTTNTSGGVFSIPYTEEMDENGIISEVARNYLDGIFEWEPGTGQLANTQSLPDAVLWMAKRISFFNELIEPSVVVVNPAQVLIINKDENANAYNITSNLPTQTSIDPDTGKIVTDYVDYLRTLDDQLGFLS